MKNTPKVYDTLIQILGQHVHWLDKRHLYTLDIIGNKQKMLAGITATQVLDGGIPPAGYAEHKPHPSPNPKSHLWCCEKHLSLFDSV